MIFIVNSIIVGLISLLLRFLLFIWRHAYGFQPMATCFKFFISAFCGTDVISSFKIHYYKQPLLISDFFLVVDWRNWETLIHYKGALFGVIGLLALLGYAILVLMMPSL